MPTPSKSKMIHIRESAEVLPGYRVSEIMEHARATYPEMKSAEHLGLIKIDDNIPARIYPGEEV
jgi:hypothetical protein